MDRLPWEMLYKILSNLGIQTLVKCRLVSKKWRACIDIVELKELVLNCQFRCSGAAFWHATNDPIDRQNRIHLFDLRDFLLIPFDGKERLQRLMIDSSVVLCKTEFPDRSIPDYYRRFRLDSEILNSLVGLRHLEIRTIEVWSEEAVLSLPDLRVCFIGLIDNYNRRSADCRLTLEAPKLKFFGTWSTLFYVNICHPEVIEQLQVGYEGRRLEQFSSLKVLEITNLESLFSSRTNIFEQLPLLEELRVHPKQSRWDYLSTCWEMNLIVDQKKLLDYCSVRIYFFGILLDNRDFEDYEFDAEYPAIFSSDFTYSGAFQSNQCYFDQGRDLYDDYLSMYLPDTSLFKSGRLKKLASKKLSKSKKHSRVRFDQLI